MSVVTPCEKARIKWVRASCLAVLGREPTELEIKTMGRVCWNAAWKASKESK